MAFCIKREGSGLTVVLQSAFPKCRSHVKRLLSSGSQLRYSGSRFGGMANPIAAAAELLADLLSQLLGELSVSFCPVVKPHILPRTTATSNRCPMPFPSAASTCNSSSRQVHLTLNILKKKGRNERRQLNAQKRDPIVLLLWKRALEMNTNAQLIMIRAKYRISSSCKILTGIAVTSNLRG